MTMSGKALKNLEASFDGLRVCKNALVVSPTEHIIRYFTFERTPYKGLFYFWSVVLPLYTKYTFFTGNGTRLAKGDYIDLGEAEFERSIARLAEIISQNAFADLRSIATPQDYLDRFGGPAANEGYTPRISAFHAALTYYLVGKIHFCIEILEDFAGKDMFPGMVDDHRLARDLARDMRLDPSAGARKIKTLEITAIKRFSLATTIAPAQLKEYGLLKKRGLLSGGKVDQV